MNEADPRANRRQTLAAGARLLASIAVVVIAGQAAPAAAQKKKAKAAKADFFFQETPGEGGKRCDNCINFEPTTGDKGTCALIEGEVCKNCFCQAWTDKKTAKKAAA
jgi:hypothetical protein